jgi:hypothetical protein
MRSIDSTTLAALAKGSLIIRHFIWITPRDLDTGDQVTPVGFWNDVGSITCDTIDGNDGTTVSRTYNGSGKIAAIDQLVLEIGIAVRTAQVVLNIIDPDVEDLVRGYQLRKAPIEWHFGIFDVDTHDVVASLYPLLVGFINTSTISTPSEGGQGGVTIEMVSDTRRLTKVSGDKRSDESQKRRSSTDNIFQYVEAMASRQVFWGQAKSSAASAASPTNGPRAGLSLLRGAGF